MVSVRRFPGDAVRQSKRRKERIQFRSGLNPLLYICSFYLPFACPNPGDRVLIIPGFKLEICFGMLTYGAFLIGFFAEVGVSAI